MGRLGIAELTLILIGVILYILPIIIGMNKKKIMTIVLINIFLGWTVVGWVVALILAISKDKDSVNW